jgi:hypothetical protein
MARKN